MFGCSRLERRAGKLACAVPRGERPRKGLDLLDFLRNATKDLGAEDKALQKGIRKEVRQLGVLKTTKAKDPAGTPALAAVEQNVLAETRKAVLAAVNQKKKDCFDLPGMATYERLARARAAVARHAGSRIAQQASRKFQVILGHLVGKLKAILDRFYASYQVVALGNYYIHPIFAAVTDSSPKNPRRAFDAVTKRWVALADDGRVPEIVRGLVAKALKFARSYAPGLFAWRKAKLPWHNNGTETFYHVTKGKYRRGSPNMMIGVTLELTAPDEMFVPLNLTEGEIAAALECVGTTKYQQVRQEARGRSARRAFERRCREDITLAIDDIFATLNDG